MISTLGQLLQDKREARGWCLATCSRLSGVEQRYLLAIEHDAWGDLPGAVYAQNFVSAYARALGADSQKALAMLPQQLTDAFTHGRKQFATPERKRAFFNTPRIANTLMKCALALLALAYLGGQAYMIRRAPELTISEPGTHTITREPLITIKGTSGHESTVAINGEIITPDNDGTWSKVVNLEPGTNTVRITTKRRYSKEHAEDLTIMYIHDSHALSVNQPLYAQEGS